MEDGGEHGEVACALESVVFWKVFKGIKSEARFPGFHPHSTMNSLSDHGQVMLSVFFICKVGMILATASLDFGGQDGLV